MIWGVFSPASFIIMRSSTEQRQLEGRVISEVRSGRAVSRRSLANVMHLSPTTAGQYVDHLMATGLLRETGLDQGALGRPKRILSVCGEVGWFAGLEFNAERVQAVRVDFSGKHTRSVRRVLAPGSDAATVLEVLAEMMEVLSEGAVGALLGIGMGVPGVVDLANGMGVDYAFLSGWRDVPLTRPMEKRYKVPVTIDNNMRVIALAERWFGGGRDFDDYIILGPRSGFGVAVMTEGRLLRGVHDAAGEAGRWPWPGLNGGRRVHDELSAPGVWRRLAGVAVGSNPPEPLETALAAYSNCESQAWQAVVTDFAHFMGCLQMLLDTRVFFLHGPLKVLGERFCAAVLMEMGQRFPELKASMPLLKGSLLDDAAGALGAASLVMEKWLPK